MSKNFNLDYIAYNFARMSGVLFSRLAPEIYIWMGKIFGRMLFILDKKHRNIVYRNLRFVFHKDKSPQELNRIARLSFENLGKNLFETLALPRVNKEYIDKYLTFEGKNFIDEALKQKRGLIYITLHLGNWELSNAAYGLMHKNCSVIVKEQKHNGLNQLLNSYRRKFGVRLIELGALRDVVRALENNESVSIVADHGARKGDKFVNFFGREVPVPVGAVKLALKFKAPILFGYIVRTHGAYHKVVIEPFRSFSDTGNKENDLDDNLVAINKQLEKYIHANPEQYLWSYKRWKHSKKRSILILDDGKVGHLRQSQTVAKIIQDLGFDTEVTIIEAKFYNKFIHHLLKICLAMFGRSRVWLSILKIIMDKDSFEKIINGFFDIVISAGSSFAAVNLIISYENKAKSIHIMRPGFASVKRFDLVIMPKHDNPPNYKNVVETGGALNLINSDYLKEEAAKLVKKDESLNSNILKIGLLLGGNTKEYRLTPSIVQKAIVRIKRISIETNTEILVTTSRRTPKDVEEVLKKELSGFKKCKLLIIANEKNIPEAVGAILGLSTIVIVSAESISMVSEAVSSQKLVIALDMPHKDEAILSDIGKRHRLFLENLEKQKYIYLVEAEQIGYKLKELIKTKPNGKKLDDVGAVENKLKNIL
ncbi:MAG TPA: hypothetical protein ENH41_03045 [Candidatus Omnitrophica bacterium]|nr:hypothetical protein [Candidatus Omnitrophota bacterium]